MSRRAAARAGVRRLLSPSSRHEPSIRGTSETGHSLIEALVAIALLGILAGAVIGGFSMALKGDVLHRRSALNTLALANGIAAVSDAAYIRCGDIHDYAPALTDVDDGGSEITISMVEHWRSGSNPAEFASRPCNPAADRGQASGDSGLQRITLSATTKYGGSTLTRSRTVVKRYGGAYPEPPIDPQPGGAVCTISAPTEVGTTWVNESANRKDDTNAGDAAMNILYLAGSRRFSYLRFEVAPGATCDEGGALPENIDIRAARVRLYTFNVGGSPACGANSCWHALERVPSSWSASSLTWRNQPCPTGYGESCAPGGSPGTLFEHGTNNRNPAYQYVEGPRLLDEVRASYAAPAVGHGWVIKEACSATYGKACGTISPGFQIRAKSGSADERPALIVVYT